MEAAKSSGVQVRVGIRGEAGSYSDGAARQLLRPLVRSGSFCATSFVSHEDLFKAVQSGAVHCGVVPIEKTLGGSLHTNYDLLLQYSNVHILAEVDFQVEHCLLALPGRTRENIRKVLSHEAVLQDCDDYLRTWGVATESRLDTGSAAREVAQLRLEDTAVVASELNVELHGLEVLARGIQSVDMNFTRSLLISADPCLATYPQGTPMKTSIVLWLPRATDALFKVLAVFSLRDINLTKMESRPVPAAYLKRLAVESENTHGEEQACKKYEYFCYLDVLEHHSSTNLQAALKHLREITPFARVLGSYPTDGADTEELCRSLAASSAAGPAVQSRGPASCLRIAIVGFGNFGQFLAKEFIKKHQVFATSKSDYAVVAANLNCTWVPWDQLADLLVVHKVDVLLISTSITSFESVVDSLPMDTLRQVAPLVAEVCSVKVFPKSVLLKKLPEECDVVCTHPMFGPESGKHGWYGLPFVFEVVRGRVLDRARRFISIFEEARCRMVSMSAEEHDQYAAASQFLTHLTGRALASLNCRPTSKVDLEGFKSLCRVIDTTSKDSFDLFYGLFKYNSSSSETIEKLKQAFADIERKLRFRRESSAEHLPAVTLPAAVGGDGDPLLVSSTVQRISESKTAAVQALSKRLKDTGVRINSALCIGEPDYPPPVQVLDCIGDAAEAGHTHYTVVQGDVELRKEICTYLREKKGVSYEPTQICVSNGGKQAIYQVLMALCEEGDEVLVPTPCWVSYHDITRLCRAEPVEVATLAADGYLLTPEQLRAGLSASGPRCRVVIICNPNNPTGAVLPHESLEALAEVLRQPEFAHVYVLADEIYEQLVFDTPHASFASLQGMYERTLLVGGFSKGYAMTGLRLGYLAADKRIVAAATKLQGQLTSCASSLSQRAGITALRDVPAEWSADRVRELQEKRDFVIRQLRAIPGLECVTPQGAFYVFVDLSGCLGGAGAKVSSGEDFCRVLLQDYKVALVPGEAFQAPLSVRLSYACSMEDLEAAMRAFTTCVAAVRAP